MLSRRHLQLPSLVAEEGIWERVSGVQMPRTSPANESAEEAVDRGSRICFLESNENFLGLYTGRVAHKGLRHKYQKGLAKNYG